MGKKHPLQYLTAFKQLSVILPSNLPLSQILNIRDSRSIYQRNRAERVTSTGGYDISNPNKNRLCGWFRENPHQDNLLADESALENMLIQRGQVPMLSLQ
ncbi:hypothetical protein ILYODFUR_018399 [Ilyodon furcidens]|uniref:Uncharacterized protein n=1 Tax=Ilyodon furcidens TaxID=33524 RepID=A0ABV0SZH4_9TELE